jgi:hypothetical protein
MIGKLANKCKSWFRKLNSEQQEGEAICESESASKIGNFQTTERSKTKDNSTAPEEESNMPNEQEYIRHSVTNTDATQNETDIDEATLNSGVAGQVRCRSHEAHMLIF